MTWMVGWLSFGRILGDGPLPARMYEVINVSIATTAFVALVVCLRYLAAEYVEIRVRRGLGIIEAAVDLLKLKLAIGFTVFLFGEFPRMTWVWFARYLQNTGTHEPDWMGRLPWLLIPLISSVVTVLGLGCILRAIVPSVWGRYGYWITLGCAVVAVVLTQTFRP